MKISSSNPALLFLTGMMCLLFSNCNNEESERETMVPLRLSMTIPATEGSLTTRAAETGKFNIALSTSSGYASNTKVYTTSSTDPSSAALTSTDPLKISRLVNTTPLTLYGTYNYSHLGNQPVFYSGNAPVAEGAVSVEPKWGNAIIVVNSGNKEKYQVNIKSLYSPTISNNQYTWNTTGKIPTLESSGANPAAFETTSTITKPSDLADGYYASVVPGRVAEGNIIMSITELNGAKQGDTYQVTTPSAINFEANKCYFITLNVNEGEIVTMDISITGMTSSTIALGTQPGIYNLQDLKDFRDAWNSNNGESGLNNDAYAKWVVGNSLEENWTVNLYADIDLKKEEWVPIKSWSKVTFDGNGHTLSNLMQENQGDESGFFSSISIANVKNLTIQGVEIVSTKSAQVICNSFNRGIISNCHIKDANFTGKENVCGFVGQLGQSGRIEGCSISNSWLVAAKTAAGIAAFDDNIGMEITACTVSGCIINAYNENSGIAAKYSTGDKITITACTVSNVFLIQTKKYHAIADEASSTKNGCYFANVRINNTEITTGEGEGEGYLASLDDLKTQEINDKLNETLTNKDSSFPYRFENGVIVKVNPN